MEETSKELYLEFKKPYTVVFHKQPKLDNNDWNNLVNWWLAGAKGGESNFIEIDFGDFSKKKKWLKIWEQGGFSYELSSNLNQKISEEKNEITNFEKACKKTDGFEKFNFNNLKLKRTLTEGQYDNICSMLSKTNGANFSVPGAGKTMTSLVTWQFLKSINKVGNLLVICPKSAFNAWLYDEPRHTFEIIPTSQLFGNEAINDSSEILVTNYEKLENKDNLSRLSQWVIKNKAMVIIDEAHRIKGGGKSVRWIACRSLINGANRVDLLTGTPMPQSYNDLRNLLSLSWRGLSPGYLTDEKLVSLKRGGVFVRTTKSELNLPPLKFEEIAIEPGEIQKQIYSALKTSYIGTFNLDNSQEQFFNRKGRAAMTLIAAATNPGLILGLKKEDAYLKLNWPPKEISQNTDLLKIVENYVNKEIPPKYKWLVKFIESRRKLKKKTLVWSNFIGNLIAIKYLLKNYNPALIYGSVNEDDRKKELERFEKDPDCSVLLTNPQTLGEGISLHNICNEAVYVDRTYNAGQYLQSLDRIHRLGLHKTIITNFYILTTKRTVDNRVGVRLNQKINRMAQMLDDEGLTVQGTLDTNDFFEDGFDKIDFSDLLGHLNSDD